MCHPLACLGMTRLNWISAESQPIRRPGLPAVSMGCKEWVRGGKRLPAQNGEATYR